MSLLSSLFPNYFLPDINNVVLFGESGAGKSSIINMLSEEEVAKISSSAVGCTFRSKRYRININDKPVTLWDTAGLNEGDQGKVPKAEAIVELYKLLRNLSDGVSLLMFVMRAPRITESVTHNWKFFRDVVCMGKVPTVIVVTGLEGEVKNPGDNMDNWWRDNEGLFRTYQITPHGHACITATRGRMIGDGYCVYDDLFERSKHDVRELIRTKSTSNPLRVPPAQWFSSIVEMSIKLPCLKWVWVLKERVEVAETTLKILKEKYGMADFEAQDLAEKMNRYK
ncbi:hypothetical protein D9756_007987 [Leucocoprinus leucothites]|uniref:G domain-containing protein n=1 Tax=Leucocoprinus leucothites TaxID=201217 RepID=A0A8H5D5X1_9AGAR|nr:hypothetical protein D9756_007987 [Leucoagaricus leucothites]